MQQALELPSGPNQVWSMDFESDALANGRRIRVLTIVDDFYKEAIDLVADLGTLGQYVSRTRTGPAALGAVRKRSGRTRARNSPERRSTSALASSGFSSS